MITIDELKTQLGEYETAVKDLGEALAITASEKRVAELEHKMSQPGFYDDAEASQKVFAEVSDLKGKLERWQKIAVSAAEQCGRGCIPRVTALYSFREALAHASHAELRLLPYENEQSLSLRAALEGSPLRTVAVMTGPEGGFEPDEVALAQEYGFQSCTLGPRILRCETAPLCALTAILYAAGALD